MSTGSAPPLVQASVLDDLRTRLHSFRSVDLPAANGWTLGIDPGYLGDLLAMWEVDYDWRQVEARIRSLPWVVARHEHKALRAVHQRAAEPTAVAVVLLHGWPDSVMRFEKVLPLLTDLHVVIPALPGYPFALPTTGAAMSAAEMATAVATLMAELGYEQYVVSAGDVGTDVAESLAAVNPDRVVALHLTDLSHHHARTNPPADLSPVEQAYLERVHRWHAAEGGYNHQQSTRPNTLAVGLGDSPAGLAAWIVEKLYQWSDCSGDLETVFTRVDVLNWVTAYWVTGAIGTSFAPYAHREPLPAPITPPTRSPSFPATRSARHGSMRRASSTSGHGSRRPVVGTSMPGNARPITLPASARQSLTVSTDPHTPNGAGGRGPILLRTSGSRSSGVRSMFAPDLRSASPMHRTQPAGR